MKRKIFSIVLALFLLLPAVGVPETSFIFSDTATDGNVTSENDVLETITFKGLSFNLNNSYLYKDNVDSAQITFEPQMSFVTITTLNGSGIDGLAESYYENSVSTFASQLNAELINQSDIDINGINAKFASYSINEEDSFFAAFLVTVMHDDIVYLISCFQSTQVEDANGEKYLDEFNNLVESLKFI